MPPSRKRKEREIPLVEKSDFAKRLIAARILRGWLQRDLKRAYKLRGVPEYDIPRFEAWSADEPEPDLSDAQWTGVLGALDASRSWFEAPLDSLLRPPDPLPDEMQHHRPNPNDAQGRNL